MDDVEFTGELLDTLSPWTLQRGDRVLVRIGQTLTAANAHDIKTTLEERFPGVMFTVIQADEILVYRDEP
jgi:hypothetical protein